jgi:hypothetical protein
MRKITIAGLAAAGVTIAALSAGITAAATSHTSTLPTADSVLAKQDYAASVQEISMPPGMIASGITSAASGFNQNAPLNTAPFKEAVIVYKTAAEAASAVTWYHGQIDDLPVGPVAVIQGDPSLGRNIVIIWGGGHDMVQVIAQISAGND